MNREAFSCGGCIYVIIVHIVGWKAVVVCLVVWLVGWLVGYVIGDMERLLLLLILVLLMKNDDYSVNRRT
jgi:hypothetical protein